MDGKYCVSKSTHPSFSPIKEGSTSTPFSSSQGGKTTDLLGARNRYALRLADQSGLRQVLRDGTAGGRRHSL